MRYKAIAIEREYASGGREVGEKLARKMEVACHGHEILERASQWLNLPLQRLADADENVPNSFFYGMAAYYGPMFTANEPVNYMCLEQRLAITEARIISDLALEPCVIVGRRAAALLADNANVLRVFIYADNNARIERAVKLYGIEPKKAQSVLNRLDKRRANYFKTTLVGEWKDPSVYHMFLNSGRLGVDGIVDVLYSVMNNDIK